MTPKQGYAAEKIRRPFPTLTGLVALAAGLAAVYGPANAPETPSKPCARHRGRRRCGYLAENLALTDR